MLLGQPLWAANKLTGNVDFNFNTMQNRNCAIYTGEYCWVDQKYGFMKNVISKFKVIVSTQDLIAHDDYIAQLKHDAIVIFFHSKGPASASPKRLKMALEKVKALGFKVKYFVNESAMKRYLNRIEA